MKRPLLTKRIKITKRMITSKFEITHMNIKIIEILADKKDWPVVQLKIG